MTIRWSPTKSAPRPLQSAYQVPVRAQMPQCCLPLSYFLVEARQIVVCVRQLFVQRDCPAVGCNRGIGALQIFEGGTEVKSGGCVLGGEPKRFLILENGFLHPPSLLEQPAEVDVRVGISRVERQRTAIRVLRIAGLDRLELLTETKPVVRRERLLPCPRMTRMAPRDRSRLPGQLAQLSGRQQ